MIYQSTTLGIKIVVCTGIGISLLYESYVGIQYNIDTSCVYIDGDKLHQSKKRK